MIFITSFLGLLLFRRCMTDVMLILLGMISFASGIFFMTFVRTTGTFYVGRTTLRPSDGQENLNNSALLPAVRSLTLFALIPMPTIRSLLSKQVPSSSCGEF